MGNFRSDLPLGTDNPEVFYANVGNLDEAVTDRVALFWYDRKGVKRKTYFALEEDIRLKLLSLDFTEVPYVAGNVIDAQMQYVIAPDGNAYQIRPDIPLPYELTGEWATDSSNFMLMGDLSLRNELSQSDGSKLIGYKNITLKTKVDSLGESKSVRRLLHKIPPITQQQLNSFEVDSAIPQGLSILEEDGIFIISCASRKDGVLSKSIFMIYDLYSSDYIGFFSAGGGYPESFMIDLYNGAKCIITTVSEYSKSVGVYDFENYQLGGDLSLIKTIDLPHPTTQITSSENEVFVNEYLDRWIYNVYDKNEFIDGYSLTKKRTLNLGYPNSNGVIHKIQSISVCNGIVFGGVGSYSTRGSENLQGSIWFDLQGNVIHRESYSSSGVLDKLSDAYGDSSTWVETEGTSIHRNGSGYSFVSCVMTEDGIYLFSENESIELENSIDFSSVKVGNNQSLTLYSGSYRYISNGYSPINGEQFKSTEEIVDLMVTTGMESFSFYTHANSGIKITGSDDVYIPSYAICLIRLFNKNKNSYSINVFVEGGIEYFCVFSYGNVRFEIKSSRFVGFSSGRDLTLSSLDDAPVTIGTATNPLSSSPNYRSWVSISGSDLSATTDNRSNIGNPSRRWSTVYAATGSINTSDEREKEKIRDISDSERRVAIELKRKFKAFKWKDAVKHKGDNARWHFGIMAQEVASIFEKNGLDAHDYGLFCFDQWGEKKAVLKPVLDEYGVETGEFYTHSHHEPSGSRYGVRYDQLLAFIISSM